MGLSDMCVGRKQRVITSTDTQPLATSRQPPTETALPTPANRWQRVLPPLLLVVLVPLLGLLPLKRNPFFYYWDDTASAFAPGWRLIGERVLDGSWPAMIPELWAGGNIAAESLFGIFNPVILADSAFMALIPDLAIGVTLVKLQFTAILAVGVYLLCREYGANTPMAFVAGMAMPVAGYTLYFDSEGWVSGLIAFSWIPHVWWSARSAARGRSNPLIAVAFGYLAMSSGNPYGAVAVVIVYFAVLVELLASNHLAATRSLVLSGVAVALTAAMVYLPLALTTQVTVRTQSGVRNDETLVPGLGDLLNLSSPSNAPYFPIFGSNVVTTPITYLAWFIVPLLPWMRWRTLISLRWGGLSLAVVGGLYGMLVLGPSNLGLFRWPARLIEYAQLPVLVVVAVCLSAGLHRDHKRRRTLVTIILVWLQTYLAWAKQPDLIGEHATGLALVVILTALALGVYFWRPRLLAVPLALGGVAVFMVQVLSWFPGNFNVSPWYFPHDTNTMKQTYGARYPGTTYVIADIKRLPGSPTQAAPGWQDLLFGSIWHAAGVNTVNSYSGISYARFDDALCLTYYSGVTCDDGINRLTEIARGTELSMLDAMKIDTVVVQSGVGYGNLAKALPEGWTITRQGAVTVARRQQSRPWPSGRLSGASSGTQVLDDTAFTDRHEAVRYSGSGQLTFARLAWPGWTAEVGGKPVSTGATPQGLLTVDVPNAAPSGSIVSIQWTPPGLRVGLLLFALGLLLAFTQSVLYIITRRRRTSGTAENDRPGM